MSKYIAFTPEQRIATFWSKVKITNSIDDCWEWQAAFFSNGYGVFCWGNRKTGRAHRYAWTITYGDIPDGLLVLHKCDNPKCCNPKHLFLGTTRDNAMDMMSKGRNNPPKGMRSGTRKLTDKQVDEIRERYAVGGITQRKLSAEYGVEQQHISRIINRVRWA